MRLDTKVRLAVTAAFACTLVAACGGGDDNNDNGGGGGGGSTTPVVQTVACSFDRTVTGTQLSYEEQRLGTPLPSTGANVVGTDARPIADRILADTGFDQFDKDFENVLCPTTGQTTITSYDQAIAQLQTSGHGLWTAAVDRVQGRRASPAGSVLPNSDDRPLYWARLQMTRSLRQWRPAFAPTTAQQSAMQLQLEHSSRGQDDINFPEGTSSTGAKYRRLIMSGFDTFTLGTPGTPNTGLRNGNPSGVTALSLDGKEYTLSDGTILHIETYLLPVNYDPFNAGMQEDTIGPWFKPGTKRVDASITMSQGSANIFNLEQWNGRFHGPSAGNDGIIYCPSGSTRLPSFIVPIGTITATGVPPITLPNSGCDVYPPQRWLGYDSTATWMKDYPPQFTTTTLPIAAMVTGKTNIGVPRPAGATSAGTDGFDVTWHTSYSYFPVCTDPATVNIASNGVVNAMPDVSTLTPPSIAWCSRQGGGGDYLSNESAYRNTLLRDTFGLDIPAGHIHTPVMTNFFGGTATTGGGTRDDNAITDARFESYRNSIMTQAQRLVVVVGQSLVLKQD